MMRIGALITAAAAALVLAGCGKITENFGSARLRVVNLAAEAGTVQVRVDDTVLATSLAYEGTLAGGSISGGTRRMAITRVGETTSLSDSNFGAAQDSNYTAVFLGYSSGYSTLLLSETTTAPSGGNFKLRMASVAQGAGSVDVYVEPVGADITAATPRVTQLFSRTVGDFQNISAGDYQVRATVAGSKDVVFDSGRITFGAGQVFTMYLYTSGSARLLQGAMVPQDVGANPTFYRGERARARLVHAAADQPTLSAIVTPGGTISGVTANSGSAYSDFSSGSRSVRVEGAFTPGAALASASFTFAPATDYSLIASNHTGSLSLISFADSTVAPQQARVRARFVNLTRDLASIDVLLGGNRVASAVTRPNASIYSDYDANQAQTLAVNAAGASTGATLPTIELLGDGVYTVYITGTAASLSRLVVKEN
jgi:hypothetical protein